MKKELQFYNEFCSIYKLNILNLMEMPPEPGDEIANETDVTDAHELDLGLVDEMRWLLE